MEIILFVCVFSLVTLGLLAYTKNEPGCEADEQQVETLYLEGRRVNWKKQDKNSMGLIANFNPSSLSKYNYKEEQYGKYTL